ncbi:multidrug ABC transporter ATP-binding protein [Anaerobacillus alkalidiazotrophicus]|uniref:Multidrug ABC transporter ATP-binding protein n=1 Tax=Anaerobacillus alkalidiazotrophicus TaxID=472963 RepID=A0A1S2M998_9BACI|nr:ABC transporter ATP-binding protein [Anaerobacillus alkalidiazotrophicus]OIJ21362.1 multidrug ABC transporter ATP-binding protein [Anaerobacillus alkalidiazotrophicus]
MSTLLELNHVCGGYHKGKSVLHDLSFSVNKGEIVGLIGLNGAGKSTTIKHVLGLMELHSGEIKINGRSFLNSPNEYRLSYSYIPETPILYDDLTLQEHLHVTAMAYGLSQEELKERSSHLLKEFRMEKMLNWFPGHFSKGMRQKVMIMCAFLLYPPLYIIDEPFIGLDPIAIKSLLNHLVLMKEQGAGILMSTHILSTAERYCDRFIMLHHGKIIVEGTLEQLREKTSMPGAALDDIYIEITKEG